MSTWLPISAALSMHSLMETWNPCVALCICHNHPTSSHTPWLESVHASVHVFMSAWLPISPEIPMHIYMETWVSQCGPVCVSLISAPTPCLECVYALVHVFMSTGLPILAWPPLHSYIETWVPLSRTVYVYQSPHFWFHNLVRVCTFISRCMDV